MKVKILKCRRLGSGRILKTGHVYDMHGGAADWLVRHKFAVAVETHEPKEPDEDSIPAAPPAGGKRGGMPRQRGKQTALAEAGGEG